ncbi:MAG: hypothetical protein K9I47_07475 [Bacteroidales bacterium]|nr:hypothetical protein [Bacteroidales bacterium]
MRSVIIIFLNFIFVTIVSAQDDNNLTIGAYGQVDYNQPVSKNVNYNGNLDVHRVVVLMGYQFNEKTRLVTEIEYEHAVEVYLEQAYLNYKFNPAINLRAGLLLIPMGIINEYHESPTFNGVERPNVDKYIIPTTWREIGAGFSGNLTNLQLRYQAYLVNGFKSYDGDGILQGQYGLRKGRQKAAKSFMTYPNFSGKVNYYGVYGLNVGLSTYLGKTQSSLYDGLQDDTDRLRKQADSSIVDVRLFTMHAKYQTNGWQFRAQYTLGSLGNVEEYNAFTGLDLGSSITGYYAEAAYNILQNSSSGQELIPFVRYEKYDTHNQTDAINRNKQYNRNDITLGIGWKMANGAMLKADYQLMDWEDNTERSNQFNAGIAFMF